MRQLDNKKEIEENKNDSTKNYKLEIALILLLFIEIFINSFVMCLTFVQGESMEPTLYNKDILISYKPLMYHNKYYYGDIVILNAKRVSTDKSLLKNQYIKRIVGLPGDIIKIENGKVYRNGKEVKESYIAEKAYTDIYGTQDTWELNNNEYFVLGDNRFPYMSEDSRYFGPIYKNELKGKTYKLLHSSNNK